MSFTSSGWFYYGGFTVFSSFAPVSTSTAAPVVVTVYRRLISVHTLSNITTPKM